MDIWRHVGHSLYATNNEEKDKTITHLIGLNTTGREGNVNIAWALMKNTDQLRDNCDNSTDINTKHIQLDALQCRPIGVHTKNKMS